MEININEIITSIENLTLNERGKVPILMYTLSLETLSSVMRTLTESKLNFKVTYNGLGEVINVTNSNGINVVLQIMRSRRSY